VKQQQLILENKYTYTGPLHMELYCQLTAKEDSKIIYKADYRRGTPGLTNTSVLKLSSVRQTIVNWFAGNSPPLLLNSTIMLLST
jgi:hypothetical protein